ncbi:cupin domain-containing protein [Bernardetia sp. ABR2-2B]|uniref:cupin domain-containing protein n=1 Tax=Bernardetia sp. ABR2-2B TaxID=3127472 RepID=UPI0030CCB66F
MNHHNQEYWIEKLNLQAHPEGGYYAENYRADGVIPKSSLSEKFAGNCSYSTAIYFLLTGSTFSAFHRIASDELWHFYDGDPLSIFYFDDLGNLHEKVLGIDIDKNQFPQIIIPAGVWFASRCQNPNGFTLSGCTVAPGFDFEDFELAYSNQLSKKYPKHRELIEELTRQ